MDNTKTSKQKTVKPSKIKLTPKQRKFVKYYTETGNGTKSAKLAGYSEKTAHVIAHENLKKPNILAMLDGAREEAEGVIISLMRTAENENVRRAAANDVLDRTVGKPIQRSESVSINITVESMLGTDA